MADTTNNQPKPTRELAKRTSYDASASPALARVPAADRDVLIQMHADFDYAYEQWQDIRQDADEDMRYVAGDPWTAEDREARVGRPILSLDQLQQYINQLVNTVRQNKRAIKVTPEGHGANDDTAELRGNRIRQIEYLSHAQEAYTTAFENECQRSFGYLRITADYESPRTRNQQLRIKAIPNPDQVLPDPDAESTAGADWKFLFYTKSIAKAEFQRDYPDATVQDFGLDLQAMSPRWIQQDRLQIAEYWTCRPVRRTCVEIQPSYSLLEKTKARLTGAPLPEKSSIVWIDGVDKGKRPAGDVLDTWTRDVPEVCMYLTNGIELLAKKGDPKKHVWKGKHIPFAAAYGKVLYMNDAGVGGKKKILSYIRLARDGQKAYNWTKSTQMEVAAMQPRTPYFAYEGQLDAAQMALIQQSMHQPVAVIMAKAFTEEAGQTVLPLPRRELPDMASMGGYELVAEGYKRDIQNAMGRYSASVGRADTNVKSGVALKQLDAQSDAGSYHFIDHYDDMIRHVGVMLDDLLPYYDDTAKDITTRDARGTVKSVRVNDPNADTPIYLDPQQQHAVTIGTGPNFDSEREQANDLAMTLLKGGDSAMSRIAAPTAIRLLDAGPIADDLAEDLESLWPPELRAAKAEKDGKGPSPAQLQQQNAQMKGQLDEAHQLLQQASQEIKSKTAEKQLEAQSKERLALIDGLQARSLQAMKDATSIRVAFITAAKERGEQMNEALLQSIALAHEEEMTRIGHAHEAALTAMQQQHEADTQAREHDHASEMAATPPPVDPNAAPAQAEA
jgi:hypothetical protein